MKDSAIVPRYYELEEFRRSVNRKLWTAVAGSAALALAAIALAALIVMKPTPVIAFDSVGRPMVFEDTISARLRLEDVRIEYFAQAFLEKYAGIDSGNLDRDLADGLNMMTPRLKEVALADTAEMERRAKFQDANVRSRVDDLQIRIAPYDAETSDKVHLVAWGRMVYEPRLGDVPDAEHVEQWFFSQMVLVRVPVSRVSIHGMWVDYVHTSFFATEDEMRVERLKRKP